MTDDLHNAIATINELRSTIQRLNAIIDQQAAQLVAVPINEIARYWDNSEPNASWRSMPTSEAEEYIIDRWLYGDTNHAG